MGKSTTVTKENKRYWQKQIAKQDAAANQAPKDSFAAPSAGTVATRQRRQLGCVEQALQRNGDASAALFSLPDVSKSPERLERLSSALALLARTRDPMVCMADDYTAAQICGKGTFIRPGQYPVTHMLGGRPVIFVQKELSPQMGDLMRSAEKMGGGPEIFEERATAARAHERKGVADAFNGFLSKAPAALADRWKGAILLEADTPALHALSDDPVWAMWLKAEADTHLLCRRTAPPPEWNTQPPRGWGLKTFPHGIGTGLVISTADLLSTPGDFSVAIEEALESRFKTKPREICVEQVAGALRVRVDGETIDKPQYHRHDPTEALL